MKLKIKSAILKEMVAKAVKGASNNKMIPLTSFMCIDLKNNVLEISTTDATNYLTVREEKVSGDDFYVVVSVDTFSKLVLKTTSEEISLALKENVLEFEGNGKYKIELPLDEDGKLVKFPKKEVDLVKAIKYDIQLSTIKTIIATAKSALATSLDMPWFTGYYIGKKIVATDTYKICGIDIELFDKPVLFSAELMNLLDLMTSENLTALFEDNKFMFISDNCKIYSVELEGIDNFPFDAINGLIDEDFESICKLPKQALIDVLDRLSLFVGTYDKNAIKMTFTNEGLIISSKQSTGSELIHYSESTNFKEYTCTINIDMLLSQIKSQLAETVTMGYGNGKSIKLSNDNIVSIVALFED